MHKSTLRGTANEPIIFTAADDDLNDDDDFTSADRGEWGGLIILGNATIAPIVILPTTLKVLPLRETRAIYGGTTDEDNSGVLRTTFLSVTVVLSCRHGQRNQRPYLGWCRIWYGN
jgi:hypothetical protein